MTTEEPAPSPITRRQMLLGAGALVLVGCSSDSTTTGGGTTSTSTADGPAASNGPEATGSDGGDVTAFTAADFDGLATCILLPETTAGPFPLDEQFDRRDVTEDYPGHPVRLGLRVVDAGCAPVEGAAVEIWHADATGDYSAFADGGDGKDEAAGTTFLRGTQTADGDGIVEFATIYPGWYRGRAVHIHLRVHVGGNTVLTSQLYFDDDYTARVLAEDPYAEFGPPDTTNSQDGIAGDVASDGTLLHLAAGATRAGEGTVALVNVGIA